MAHSTSNTARTINGSSMYRPGATFRRWASSGEAFNVIAEAIATGRATSRSTGR